MRACFKDCGIAALFIAAGIFVLCTPLMAFYTIKQNSTEKVAFIATLDGDPVTGLTASAMNVYYTKPGGSSAQLGSPTISEEDADYQPGLYWLTLTTGMTDTVTTANNALVITIQYSATGVMDVCHLEFPIEAYLVSELYSEVGNKLDTIDALLDAITAKMPTNYLMGSSDQTDKDDEIDAILADTGTDGVIVNELTATALYDFLSVDSGGTFSNAVAGSAIYEIANGAWDIQLSDHTDSGSSGEAMAAAGTAGDPWTTTLPGSYTGQQAGALINAIFTYTNGVKDSSEWNGIESRIEAHQ